MNLLIVDDNATNRKLLRVTLEAEGFLTAEAADGIEALSALETSSIDAIISDILMPRMDGFRLCHAVREHERFGHLPFLVYSSTYTSLGDEKLALDSGADRYLRKPCPVATMVGAIREVVAEAQLRRSERSSPPREPAVMLEYNQALVRKLEEKNEKLERAAARQRMVVELSQQALTDTDLATLLDEAACVAAQALEVEYCAIWDGLPDGQELRLRAGVGWRGEPIGSATVSAWVLGSPTLSPVPYDPPRIAEQLYAEERFRDAPLLEEHGVACSLCVGIQESPGAPSVLSAHTTRPRAFTVEDVDLLQTIANVLAATVSRWHADRELRLANAELDQRVEELRSVNAEVRASRRAALNLMEDALQARKQAEELNRELRETRDYLDNLLRHANAPIIVWDPNLRITLFNAAFERLTGLRADEARGRTLDILFPEDQKEEALSHIRRTATGEHWEVVEIPIQHCDGTVRTVLWNSATLYSVDGTAVVATIAQGQDITDRKRALDELRAAQERLAHEHERISVTLRSIGDAVIATDSQGRVTLINRVAEALCGWSEAEAVGRPLDDVFEMYNESTGQRADDPVAKVLQTGQVQALANQTVLVARDGTRRYLADSAAPIRDDSGKIGGVVLVFQDVTLQRKLEEEMLKANKLESLGVLAGGIAHDFNNLLVGVLGNITLAKLEAAAESEQYELLGEAEKAANRAKSLTQQLLTFAKGGAPIRRVVSLGATLAEATKFVLRGSRCQGKHHIAPDLWPAQVDTGQLAQVIHNLVINAVQAMPAGGRVTLSADNCAVTEADALALPPGDYVKISVSDTGVGIPPENLKRIYDPYFTTKPGGSGLGLAICYSIVAKHDGCITVDSTLGEGTSFHVYLPAAGEHADVEPSPAINARKGRVLVMDDEEVVRRVSRRMLEKLGYESEIASDGQEAVERYREALEAGQPFDIVVLDLVVFGGVGGLEALRRLRQIHPHVRAIVCSGYSNDPAMSHFANFGFAAMLDKPASLDELQASLEAAMAAGN